VSDAVLSVERLTTGYEEAPVIRELDLSVGSGEVVALLGANGAGKTTTLRAISGIVHPMAGRIAFAGSDIAAEGAGWIEGAIRSGHEAAADVTRILSG